MIAGSRMKIVALGLLTMGAMFALVSPAWGSETFGVESFTSSISSNAEGTPATQAGSHPYALTTAITFNHVVTGIEEERVRVRTYGDPKNIEVNLPAGVIINPRATEARCTEAELESAQGPESCPNASAVGVFSIYLDGIEVIDEPVYNMVAPTGVPAELGFNASGIGVVMHIAGKVRTGGDYGLSAGIFDISQRHPIYKLELTLWGDPSQAGHDDERGLCAGEEAKAIFKETGIQESCPVERTSEPFLTLPTSCTGQPLSTSMSVDSWQEPGKPVESPPAQSPALTGCEKLDFSPKLTVSTAEPQTASAESPTGLSLDLKIPYEESLEGPAEADLRDLTLTLPAGMAISPSAATGRAACTAQEIGLDNANTAACPEASTLGAAKITTPLLEGPLEGSIYLAQQRSNPFGSLLAVYLVAEGDGILIKLAGEVTANLQTGQLAITFDDLPQLPVSEMKLSLFGGPRALLVTPPTCGTYTAQGELTPWDGAPAVRESSTLEIASGPNGGACPSGAFSPSFTAGTLNNEAGASSSFSLTFFRHDGEQRLGSFAVQLPPGLLATLKDLTPCPEPQASLGQCSPSSQIGTSTIAAGPGEDPLYLPEPGQAANPVYLTGPYEGAPFGLSIVVLALAGPFDLGTVVVRAKIEVDPHTAQLTIASDPLPLIREGIPLDIRTVNVTINRAGLMINPTNCDPLTVAGTITSSGGTSARLSSPFEAANCVNLPFKPKLSALAHAQTSRMDGAYLHLRLVSGPGQAGIAKLKIDLPKQLSARLHTLQKACAASVFNADPANCPGASDVGTATVVTPLFKKPFSGPAYLVSEGAEAYPHLDIVLQGEGITLVLVGYTSIRKGITAEAFRSVPDVPLSEFDLVLPMGPQSLLAANLPSKAKRSLCSQTLQMTTAIIGQNGAVVKQSPRMLVSGCPKPKHRHG